MSLSSPGQLISMYPVLWRLGVAALLLTSVTTAQRYHVHTYSELDGLPSSRVNSLLQDSLGRMWFATRSGVASFDGAKWRRYGVHDGLASLDQAHVLLDANGRIWTLSGLTGFKLAWFDGERWQRTATDPGIAGTRSHAVTLRSGPRDFIIVGAEDQLRVWDGHRWRSRQLGAADGEVRGIHSVVGECLVHSSSSGLLRFDPVTLALGAYDAVPERSIYVAAFDADTRRLWVVSRNGTSRRGRIGVLDRPGSGDGGFRWYAHDFTIRDPSSSNPVALADCLGGLYFGTWATLYYYHPTHGLERMSRKSGPIAEGTTTLGLDREHHVWVGGTRGVTKILGRRLTGLDQGHGLLDREVTAVAQRRSGEIILGHATGLTIVDPEPRTIEFKNAAIHGRVMDLTEGPDGKMWIAGSALGVGLLDAEDQITWSRVVSGEVCAIEFDHEGSMWIASDTGLYRGVAKGIEQVETQLTAGVRNLSVAPDGAVYAATSLQGVFRIHGGEKQQFQSPSSDAANQTFSTLVRASGEVWVGTLAGLYQTSGDQLVVCQRPRIEHPVYFIVENDGETWLGTDRGVFIWKGGELILHDMRTGLIGQETNRAAGVVARDGRMWIGTDRGVSIYNPEFDRVPPVAPTIGLLHIDAEGKHLPIDVSASLDQGRSSLAFPFRATSFADEYAVRFRTYLEGFDSGWTEPRRIPLREVRYANLAAGEYRFHLRAIDVHGRESEVASSALITIRRPIWQETWFRILAVLMSIAGATMLVSFFTQRRHARQLEIEILERTEELRRLESERTKTERLGALGLLAGGIAHDFNNLLTGIVGYLSLLEHEDSIQGTARGFVHEAKIASNRAQALTTQLLTFAKGGTPVRKAASIQDVIRESCSFILSGSNVRCEFDLPDDLRPVEIDENQMSQVINNLMLNARGAMPNGGTVQIRGQNLDEGPRFLPEHAYVLIEFEDDGTGIPAEFVDQVFDPYFTTKDHGSGLGLASAFSIVKRHDGHLTVDSKPGRGARFRMYLPATEKPIVTVEPRIVIPRPASGCILIMDDDVAVREILERILTKHGYACLTAPDGQTAIEMYETALHRGPRIDAVILDLTVAGGMGGLETSRRLVEIKPDIKMLVATGYSNDPVMANHAEYGFCGRISKPFAVEELTQAVEDALRSPSASTEPSRRNG